MKLTLLGAPGAGKGTQAEILSRIILKVSLSDLWLPSYIQQQS